MTYMDVYYHCPLLLAALITAVFVLLIKYDKRHVNCHHRHRFSAKCHRLEGEIKIISCPFLIFAIIFNEVVAV